MVAFDQAGAVQLLQGSHEAGHLVGAAQIDQAAEGVQIQVEKWIRPVGGALGQ